MACASYGSSTRSSGVVRIVKDLDLDLAGRHVLIVEDIIDSGLTLSYLRKTLSARQPRQPGGLCPAGPRECAAGRPVQPALRGLHDPPRLRRRLRPRCRGALAGPGRGAGLATDGRSVEELALRLVRALSAPLRWAIVRPLVMGVVNVTPDSFSDGGVYEDHDAAIAHGLQLIADGADVIDVGGESTRPGAAPVEAPEELRRVLPVVTALSPHVRISIDTRNASTAHAAISAGASIVNDVSASLLDGGRRTGRRAGSRCTCRAIPGRCSSTRRTTTSSPMCGPSSSNGPRPRWPPAWTRSGSILASGSARRRRTTSPSWPGSTPSSPLASRSASGCPARRSSAGCWPPPTTPQPVLACPAWAPKRPSTPSPRCRQGTASKDRSPRWCGPPTQGVAMVRVHDVRATADALTLVAA